MTKELRRPVCNTCMNAKRQEHHHHTAGEFNILHPVLPRSTREPVKLSSNLHNNAIFEYSYIPVAQRIRYFNNKKLATPTREPEILRPPAHCIIYSRPCFHPSAPGCGYIYSVTSYMAISCTPSLCARLVKRVWSCAGECKCAIYIYP